MIAAGNVLSVPTRTLSLGWRGQQACVILSKESLGFAAMERYPRPEMSRRKCIFALKSDVMLNVYNMLGQEVATLVDESQEAGFKLVIFDATRLASRIYFYRIQAGSFVDTKRLLILKWPRAITADGSWIRLQCSSSAFR
jgi:hypothetical protein